jgi:hypothetical protein
MQQIDHYLRQAKAARLLALDANSETVRSQFVKIADHWESLARERLSVLQLKTEGPAPAPGDLS